MRAIRPGGVYLLLPHGQCYETGKQAPPCISGAPKAGVRQLNYATRLDFERNALEGLDELSRLFGDGALTVRIDKAFALADAAAAFNYSAGPGAGGVGSHLGKIALRMTTEGANPPVLATSGSHAALTATTALTRCLEVSPSPLDQRSLLRCSNALEQPSPKSECALQCSLASIGVYWACAAVCIEKLAPNSCITVGCLAAVATVDVACLMRCPNATTTRAQ